MKIFNGDFKVWLHAALVRAVKTFIQSATAILSTAAVLGDLNILYILNTAGLAFVFSLVTSVAGLPELGTGTENKYKAMFIRAFKTMAQTAGSMLASAVLVSDVDWLNVLSASVLAGLVSLGMNFKPDKLPEVSMR